VIKLQREKVRMLKRGSHENDAKRPPDYSLIDGGKQGKSRFDLGSPQTTVDEKLAEESETS
jgi:hypothetical protein